MPDHLGTALTASNHGDDPTGRVGGGEEVVVRIENDVTEVWGSPGRNIRNQAGPEHDVLGADGPAIDPHGKALLVEGDLTHFGAKLDIWQGAGDPLQVLIEFLATDPYLRPVDKPVEALVGPKECEKGVLTRGIDECHEVFQVRHLEDGLLKQQAWVPLEVPAPVEETGVEAGRCEQGGEAEIEGPDAHPDRVERQIGAQQVRMPVG